MMLVELQRPLWMIKMPQLYEEMLKISDVVLWFDHSVFCFQNPSNGEKNITKKKSPIKNIQKYRQKMNPCEERRQ